MGDIIFGLASIIFGGIASWGLYWLLDKAVRFLPAKAQEKFRAVPFLLPAAALLLLVSFLPLIQTLIWSFMDAGSRKFVGLDNYIELFSVPTSVATPRPPPLHQIQRPPWRTPTPRFRLPRPAH